MAKSFAEDGAVGAGGPGMSSAPAPGTVPSASASGGGGSASQTPTSAALDAEGQFMGGGGAPRNTQITEQQAIAKYGAGVTAPGALGTMAQASAGSGSAPGVFFDQGGSVPGGINDGDGDDQSQGQDPMSAVLQRSMGSVDQVLQQMYKSYGLGGQDQQGGVQDEAANMPTVPAGQSETGIPPMRPGPGTLPPTSNPFGKRTAANMPTAPAGQSETGIPPMRPGPGTLPPTSNPFGKRADAGGIQDDDDQESA